MFCLCKAAIIGLYVSENVKRKLFSPSHVYDYTLCGRDLALTLSICGKVFIL